jgi:hypothetical protein
MAEAMMNPVYVRATAAGVKAIVDNADALGDRALAAEVLVSNAVLLIHAASARSGYNQTLALFARVLAVPLESAGEA